MEHLKCDLRDAFRQFRKKPGFTTAVVIMLALGIGANSAIFSVIHAALLRPLPYPNAERLILVYNNIPRANVRQIPLSPPEYLDYSSEVRGFEQSAGFTSGSFNLTGNDEPERLQGATVSAGFFGVLGISAADGRTFSNDDEVPGADPVVLMGHGLWQRRFGSKPEIVGQRLVLNGVSRTVLGVMPPGFAFPDQSDIWIPMTLGPQDAGRSRLGAQSIRMIARLMPGISLVQAQAEINAVAKRFYQKYIDFYEGDAVWNITLVTLYDQIAGSSRTALLTVFGAAGFVLFIACANAANLLLASAADRYREFAVRLAIGAGRGRLIRQLLTESVLLALIGGMLGLLLAAAGVELLGRFNPEHIPRINEVRIDWNVAFFTLLVSVFTGVVFGVACALKCSKLNLSEAIKDGSLIRTKSVLVPGLNHVRNVFVVVEVALAVVLLIGAGLLLRSFGRLMHVDLGFNPEHILTAQIAPPAARYPGAAAESDFYGQIVERMQALPGVFWAGGISNLPLSGQNHKAAFYVDGPVPDGVRPEGSIQHRLISGDYFRAMNIALIEGRGLSSGDGGGAPLVAVINRTMARRYWPDQSPIGKRISFQGRSGPWYSVVGVVADIKHSAIEDKTDIEAYMSYAQKPFVGVRGITLVIKTDVEPEAFAGALRRQVAAVDQDQPVYNVRTMEQVVARSLAQPRFTSFLMGCFAALAFTLAALGVYSVLSYSVSRRSREIGVRLALGAKPGRIVRLIVAHGIGLTVTGIGFGIAAAYGLTSLISTLLYETSSTDALTFAAVAALLLAAALPACYLPARRAMNIEPVVVLRSE